MRNSNRLAALVLSALTLVMACEDDPFGESCYDCGGLPYRILMPLTSREAVLNNIEYAYDNRKIDAYDELLDSEFTFFFSDGDVDGGLPVQWPRTDELGATNDLFISNTQPVPVGPECQSIRMDLTLSNLQWVEIIPQEYPDETWYTTPVYYDFTFKMAPGDTYNSEAGSQAQFTVREVAVGSGTEWRLVEWRDAGNDSLTTSRSAVSTKEATWGGIKGLYH